MPAGRPKLGSVRRRKYDLLLAIEFEAAWLLWLNDHPDPYVHANDSQNYKLRWLQRYQRSMMRLRAWNRAVAG